MTQKHISQFGTFHITTNTKGKVPWLVSQNIPEILIDNLIMTKNLHKAELYAFCILPNHMHILLKPGELGLSAFMHSFKRNSSWHVRNILNPTKVVHELHPAAEVHEPPLREDIGWQKGFHDERIRDARQRTNALTYIQYNAWKHGMRSYPENWPWSSLHFQHLIDPTNIFE